MKLRTACPLDCPDTCSIDAEVVDGRLLAVTAAPGNSFTQDFICQKVSKHAERVYSPLRILTPMLRTGPKGSGEFAPISWAEALALFVEKVRAALATHGADSVVPYLYNSSAGALNSSGVSERLWAELGAAEVEHTICAATTGASWEAVYGDMPSVHPGDVVHSKFIVVWGANPTVSNIHLPPLIHQAQLAGAKLVVIDPRRTGIAKRADWHLAVRPGTDVALAYGMANHLHVNNSLANDFIERHASGAKAFLDEAANWPLDRTADVTGVDADTIAEVAAAWAATRPSMLRFGWGPERNRNGGSSCRAILSLPVLMGHFGDLGSGVLGSTSGLTPTSLGRLRATSRLPHRMINMNSLGAVLCGHDGHSPVDVFFVQGANPAVMNPNQRLVHEGLRRDDLFTVVHDQVMTDTCNFADLVLPATTHFEVDDVAGSYGSYILQPVHKVIEPVGESLSNIQLAQRLAHAFGFDTSVYDMSAAQQIDVSVQSDLVKNGNADEFLAAGGIKQFLDVLPEFSDGAKGQRAQLCVPELGDLAVPKFQELVTPNFPFTVISPATHRTINSMFGEFNSPKFTISIHPSDASILGLEAGVRVRVWNELGSIELPANLDPDQRTGTVTIPKGIWMDAAGGLTVNALVPDSLNDLADGACFNDTRVAIERALPQY